MNKSNFLKLFISIALIVSVSIFINTFVFKQGVSSTKTVKQTERVSDDDDKPAEEVYKNIQVLKGMPANDLNMVMHFMRASLNVRCSFCHVHNADNTWTFESDSIEQKNTARKMIEMVKSINTLHFGGNNAVTCYTCHNGSSHPMRTPGLPQIPPKVVTNEPTETLPEASIIIDNYTKALGKNPDKIKTKYSKGTSSLWDGKSYPIEIYQQAPDKFLSVLTAPDGSKTYRGYDGKNGWTQNSEGVQPVEGYSLKVLKDYADFYRDIDFKNQYSEIRVIGTDTADGFNCYVLRGILNDKKTDRLYFDISSGLLIRRTTYSKSILGSIPNRIQYGNYTNTDGVMSPYSVEFSYLDPWAEVFRQFTEVKYNVSMESVNFSAPAK